MKPAGAFDTGGVERRRGRKEEPVLPTRFQQQQEVVPSELIMSVIGVLPLSRR
jgi:hypothetical protein